MGRDAKESRYSWVVALLTKQGDFACGSSLITRNWLLTAAHCLENYDKSQLIANIASNRWNVTVITRQIVAILIHPEYAGYPTHHDDIALVKLDKPVTFDPPLMPICMPGELRRPNGNYYTTVGWGRMEDDFPSKLQEVDIEHRSDEHCSFWWKDEQFNYTIQICAGGDQGPCVKDYGSPLMYRFRGKYILAGITAYGYDPCGTFLYPAVYTRISYYVNWIENNLREQAKELCYY